MIELCGDKRQLLSKMDSHRYRYFIFITAIIVGAYSRYEENYYGRIFLLPENEDSQRPLALALPEAQEWCTNNLPGSTFPKISEDRDSIFKFIENAFAANRLNNGQIVLVNGIKHSRGGWSWINGHDAKGIDVKTELRDDKVTPSNYGYLWTEGEYSIQASQSSDERYYICEFEKFSKCSVNISGKCYRKKNVRETRFQARSSCITDNGDLASFETLRSSILKVSLQNLFRDRRGPDEYWIGIQRSRLHLDDKDSEIKFINWTDVHQSGSRGNNNCLCLNASRELKWLECDCRTEYPFICTGIEIKPSSSIDQPSTTSMIISDPTIPLGLTDRSAIIGAVVSCFIIVVIIIIIVIVVVIISRRQRNRPVKAYMYEASTIKTTDERNIYSEIQEPGENQTIASCPDLNTTYATIQPTLETNEEFNANNIVYAELDLSHKA